MIALAAIAKNEGRYLLEWALHHYGLGFEKIILYDNGSEDNTGVIAKQLARNYNFDHRCWSVSDGMSPQISAYNDIMKNYQDECKWIAFFDLDEFLLETSAVPLLDIVARLDKDAAVGAIGINQRIYGDAGETEWRDAPVICRFPMCSNASYEEGKWIKSIYKTSSTGTIFDCHGSKLKKGIYVHPNGKPIEFEGRIGKSENIEYTHLQLSHYILKSKEEFMKKRERGGGMGVTEKERKSRYENIAYFDSRSKYANAERCAYVEKSCGRIVTQLNNFAESNVNKAVDANKPTDVLQMTDSALSLKPRMTNPEVEAFARSLNGVRCLREFGCGGSTILAAAVGVSDIVSVDSDPKWLDKVAAAPELAKINFRPVHVDIGPLGDWGFPADNSQATKWSHYYTKVWESALQEPDIVFVDGRFRVACTLYSLLQCSSRTKYIIHDFWNRDHYHCVLEFLDCIEQVDTLGVFATKKVIDWRKLALVLQAHALDSQ